MKKYFAILIIVVFLAVFAGCDLLLQENQSTALSNAKTSGDNAQLENLNEAATPSVTPAPAATPKPSPTATPAPTPTPTATPKPTATPAPKQTTAPVTKTTVSPPPEQPVAPPAVAEPTPIPPERHHQDGRNCTWVMQHEIDPPTCVSYGTCLLYCTGNDEGICGMFSINLKYKPPVPCEFWLDYKNENRCRWCNQLDGPEWTPPPVDPGGYYGNGLY